MDGTQLLSYDILPLTPSFHQTNLQLRIASQIDLQGLLDFDSMMQNNNLSSSNTTSTVLGGGGGTGTIGNSSVNMGNNTGTSISPPIPVVHQGHQADDEEDEEEDNTGFMSIIPKNQHGHKFLNGFDIQNATHPNTGGANANATGGGTGGNNSGKSSESFSNFFNW